MSSAQCSMCKSPGTNKSTCPYNYEAINHNYDKHPLVQLEPSTNSAAAAYDRFDAMFSKVPELVEMDRRYGATKEQKRKIFEKKYKENYWYMESFNDNGVPVSFISAYDRNNAFFIWFDGTIPGWRQCGHMTYLFKLAEAEARLRGAPRIEIHTDTTNPKKVEFLESLGYKMFRSFQSTKDSVASGFTALYFEKILTD